MKEPEPFPIRWKCPARFRRKGIVYGPAYRPMPRKRKPAGIKLNDRPIYLDAMEREALTGYRERRLTQWLDALGLHDELAALPDHELQLFRLQFARFAAQLPLSYLHTIVVGDNDDTGEQLVISCAIPATPQLRWRPPPLDITED